MKSTVSIVGCGSYSYDAVSASVRRAAELSGGLNNLGSRVLLKVNLLRPSRPEEAIVTHPMVVKAVVELLQSRGHEVVIGDSPGGPMVERMLKRAYKLAGLLQVVEETGASLNYDVSYKYVPNPGGKLIKGFQVLNVLDSVDSVVTLPKLKTHVLMQFTGSTKILFGLIPGLLKSGYHGKLKSRENFAEMLVDLLQLVKPELSIMDGVIGMDGDGPAAGSPKQVGLILASSDSVALDAVACSVVGFDPGSVPTLWAAIQRGLWSGRLEDISIIGEPLDSVRVSGFRPPLSPASSTLMSLLGSVSRSLFIPSPHSNSNCVGCGICVENCPVDAITLKDGRARMDLSMCIRCYCCHEMCPHHAVDLRRNPVVDFLRL
ncbi:MAG: DUF362 domain-containing protein [Candidatus Altiarchaeota archaeon]